MADNAQTTIEHYNAALDLHELVFQKATTAAVHALLDHLRVMYTDVTADTRLRLLMDCRASGPLPVTQALGPALRWARGLRVHPQIRIAIVLRRPDTIATLTNSLLNTLHFNHLQVRYFIGETTDEAVAWLTRAWDA